MPMVKVNRGFSVVEAAMGTAAIGIIGLIALGINNIMVKSGTSSNIVYQADSFRKKIISTLQNDAAWQNTVNDPTNRTLVTNCLATTTACANGTGGLLVVRDGGNAPGNIIFDSTSTTNGFDFKGALCTGFDNVNGNNLCPFHMDITWTAVCPGASCTNPQVQITAALSYAPKRVASGITQPFAEPYSSPLNVNNYGVNMIRGATLSGLGTGTPNFLTFWLGVNQISSSNIYVDPGTQNVELYTAASPPPGTPAVPAQALVVNGNISAVALISSSDRRLKTDIRPIEGLDLVLKMQGVRFRWAKNQESDFGVIAQDIEQVLPDAVVTDPNTSLKSVKYQNMVAPLIEAIKELNEKVKLQSDENSNLRVENGVLRDQNQSFAKKIAEVELRLQKMEQKNLKKRETE